MSVRYIIGKYLILCDNYLLQKKLGNAYFFQVFIILNGVSGEIRTRDPRLRRALLYPAELRRQLRQQNNYTITLQKIQ